MNAVPVALLGASGRLGRLIDERLAERYADRLSVVARLGSSSSAEDLAGASIVIDVSLPAGTERLVSWLESSADGPATIVSGTTGLSEDQLARLQGLGASRRVLHATNFSSGVAALNHLLRQSAAILKALGYTPVITETHHRHKQDAPSGTALTLEKNLAPYDAIDIHSIRAGEVPGTHEVAFFGDDDQLYLRHEARDRGAFATGAIEAALWLHALDESAALFDGDSYFQARFGEHR